MIYTPGIAVSQLSGSVGGITASRNKGGQYFRNRAIPVTSTTAAALAQKARLAAATSDFQTLTVAQRLAWREYAAQNPSVNALGMPKQLTGHQIFVGIHSRMSQAGDTPLVSPPIVPAADALVTMSITADIGTGSTEVAFTTTPLDATEHLWLTAAKVQSTAINYVENLKRVITITAAALSSGFDYQTVLEAVLGTMVEGETVHMFAAVYDDASGLLSPPLRASAVIEDTP